MVGKNETQTTVVKDIGMIMGTATMETEQVGATHTEMVAEVAIIALAPFLYEWRPPVLFPWLPLIQKWWAPLIQKWWQR